MTGKSESSLIRINIDSSAFTRKYSEWRKMAKSLNGDDIGVPGDERTLYDWITEQGRQRKSQRCGWIETLERLCDSHRPSVQDRRELEDIHSTLRFMMPVGDSWGETKDWIEGLLHKPGKDVEMERKLRKYCEDLIDSGEKSPENQDSKKRTILAALMQHLPTLLTGRSLNPRNICFEGIDKIKRAQETATKIPVYGHYRTPKYVRYRRIVLGIEEQDAVDKTWFSASKGEAQPPMWQALFGWKNDLLTVVEAGLDLLDNGIEVEIPTVAVRGKGSAEMAFRVKPIREAIRRMVKDSSFITKSGSFATARAAKELSELSMKGGDYLDNRAVLELAGHGGLEGRVVEFRVDLSRRQVLVMAKLAGWKGNGGVDLHLTKRMWGRHKQRLNRDSAIIELSRRVGWRMAIEEVEELGAKAALILYRSKKGDLGFYRKRNSSFSKLSLSTESSYMQRIGYMDDASELRSYYSQYTEMRYPLHLPFGNLIRRMEYDSRLHGGLLRCGICNRKGRHNRRTCEPAKTRNRDVCP
uniref:Uncharacterized protein n=1 Tax=uncultured marine group II/III euryarchaeote KM3_98_F04 TaxID=1456548 RepID=A0A075I343_9EURY|nr:hypothetical protein [uncultured marine group II/III euryarchaeote KM3_98_F04]